MSVPVIPPNASLLEVTRFLNELSRRLRNLENRTRDNTSGWAGNQSNVTPDRAYDANSTTTAELADVLGTLIADLLEVGLLK